MEAAVIRSTAWLALTNHNSAPVAGEGGTLGRERFVVGPLMTRCPSQQDAGGLIAVRSDRAQAQCADLERP